MTTNLATSRQWSDADIRKMIELWRDNYSASQIGVVLGRSRSAVLGRLMRSGQLNRRPRSVTSKGRNASRRAPAPRPKPVEAEKAPEMPVASDAPKILRSELWEPIDGTTPVSVVDHAIGTQCAWPVTGGMCGQPIARGSFCAAHAEVGYKREGGVQ